MSEWQVKGTNPTFTRFWDAVDPVTFDPRRIKVVAHSPSFKLWYVTIYEVDGEVLEQKETVGKWPAVSREIEDYVEQKHVRIVAQ